MHKIRKATPQDVVGIRDVATKAWYNTYMNIYAAKTVNELLAASYNEQHLLKRLENQLFLVVEEDENIIGFANFIYGSELFLSAHYVSPLWQHHGYGSELLTEGLSYFNDEYKEVFLEVDNKNDEAVSFYEQKGFEKLRSYTHVMYGEAMDLALMRKTIN
ncbi:GNAT family N-acetyltransferase [Staphylococcus saprophyticus]|uniref:GNAT family N-acetyltransferase n=1 Tax=Staphylococcus saprophyticus TaxID=29385 RepID=UPI0022EB3A2B|nr:GNAT family N-acetyltransferase [Staphylococcus saprophyticus]MDW4452640.1 GNAT family N-acetyltransferase [Staphylococcus saprophyticus]MDW4454995.1 GNAT family N-acetyltransferase [Staphylococcus saprophyticus]MDW4490178.1 GNAT family N-acetyltransferase [Staphylococcus saprophyticus]MDW4518627.1 GNAT family N-acetyltransferase [Staphylococcus saprophyticus]MDW4558870.1 GNAT family N-acetyltransferase [Staphylococcus saprophyticus]